MSSLDKLKIKLADLLLSSDKDTLVNLKEFLYHCWEECLVTNDDHCDIEALIDEQLRRC